MKTKLFAMWHNYTNLNREVAENQLLEELQELLEGCNKKDLPNYQEEISGFFRLFCKYWRNTEPCISWNKIQQVPSRLLIEHDLLPQPSLEEIRQQLNKLVVVKLNGGLGTTMNCKGPKSLVPVRQGSTFLDITVHQIVNLNVKYSADVPLVLMNSFNTDENTRRTLRKYKGLRIKIFTFMQHKYPRIHHDSFVPLPCSYNDAEFHVWYPPGHGDFYESFCTSGLCQEFLNDGREYCFVSNIDNLGAIVDLQVLNFLANPPIEPHPEFIMEVTNKTASDIKGGALIYCEGNLRLLEVAEVPNEHLDDFMDVKKFRVFNTNNLWMKLEAISRLVRDGGLNMPVIENTKSIKHGHHVIQLETAVGSAIENFNGSIAVIVPRSRFLPVKSTADLFLIRSNVYTFEDGIIRMNAKRSLPGQPLVKMGDDYLGSVSDLDTRFKNMPDVRDLAQFSVMGNVNFGKNVTMKGNVTIIANQWEQLDIPPGSVLENKIVTGSLRIIDQ